MNNLVTSSILSILSGEGAAFFRGIKGWFRLLFIKQKLNRSISSEILKRYGNEVYYNDLDHFLTQNTVVENIIRNCINQPVFGYKSRSQVVDYYVKLFIESYQNYAKYHYEIKRLILRYFQIIFLSLNRTDSESARVICNISKELSAELSDQISAGFDRTGLKLDSLNTKIDGLNSMVNNLMPEKTRDDPVFLSEDYRLNLSFLFPSYSSNSYIRRKLYDQHNKDEKLTAIDALLKDNKVLLLGEAGLGKTYESISLLRAAISDSRTESLIPVLLQLHEFGTLYSDIRSGIKHKIGDYCVGDQDQLIAEWFRDGKLLLIFDGIDDIPTDALREKFVIEANDLIAKYGNNLFFFTARYNRYQGELSFQKEYTLTKVDELTIREELRQDGIVVDIPNNYYELFSNPFFLSVGKTILKNSHNRQLFNRSQLLSELFIELYTGLESKKGRAVQQSLSYSEALSILGKIAYESFDRASYSILEFDQLVSDNATFNKAEIISSFISSGLFLVTDRVTFVHKLLKEFCTAYYLVKYIDLKDNTSLYEKYITNDNWREVMLFASGLYNDFASQDCFLDLVMQKNLSLYVDCVNSKSDLLLESPPSSSHELAIRLLSQIHRTYSYIIPHYFTPISNRFDPQSTDAFLPESGKKVGIFGCLSQNGECLQYFFDVISKDEKEIVCIAEQDFSGYLADFEKRAVCERRNISYYGVGLKLSGLQGDSGRKLAIDIIKNRIKKIIENKELIESPYLLCERLAGYKRKIKELRDVTTLSEMKGIVDAQVERVRKTSPNVAGITYNGIELFDLQRLITTLYEHGISYTNCLLPNEDVTPTETGSHWIWDFYSEEQKAKRLSYFFYFHELSYIYMVERNFPRLCLSFSRYKDTPYQTVVVINHKSDSECEGFLTDPTIEYYYIAAEGEEIPLPIIIESADLSPFQNHEKTIVEIQNSYLRQGKVAHDYAVTQTGFSSTLTSRRSGAEVPLSDYVYESIKTSLKEVLGS